MDVDVYSDDGSTKMDVKGMKVDIQIILGRMKSKNPNLVNVPGKFKQEKLLFHERFFFKYDSEMIINTTDNFQNNICWAVL
jgi:hypothetical protein